MTTCSVEDCDRDRYCRGYCGLHYKRFRRHGDPLTYLVHENRVQHTSYNLAHARLASARGAASTHPCDSCGAPARDWAYKGGAPDEQTGANSRGVLAPYSENFDYYEPLCRTCHRRRDYSDKLAACKYGHPWTEADTAYDADGARRCRACARDRYHANKHRRKATA